MIKYSSFLFLLIMSLNNLIADIVVLRNGKEYVGKVSKKGNLITVKKGRNLYRFPARMVHGIYKSRQALNKQKESDVFFTMKKPLPTITIEVDEEIVVLENKILLLNTSDKRKLIYESASQDIKEYLPSLSVMEQWLRPLKHPKANKKVVTVHTPWLKDNARAIFMFKIPKNYDPKKQSYPIVISLHGTDDNPVAMSSHMHHVTKNGCFHLAPRTTGRRFWQDPVEIENLYNLIAYISMNYRIDPRRIILCGGSGGGMGTWSIVANHPMLFSRAGSFSGMPAIPVAAVKKFKFVPIYILHGDKDHIPVSGPRKMVKELKRLKYEHVYVEYKGDHFPPGKRINDFRVWLQKAIPKKEMSPRPAVNQFIKRVEGLLKIE
ncbi:MAG: hypothetical protein COA79_12405 [Planctomycetota bacterium]|nr:MAG: hypothetical protein COA79_12405 [Planctomycetota bacterium]